LRSEPEKILVIDDLSASYEWNLPTDSKAVFVRASILDEEKMKRAFSSKPHYTFHVAALFANQNRLIDQRCFQKNILMLSMCVPCQRFMRL